MLRGICDSWNIAIQPQAREEAAVFVFLTRLKPTQNANEFYRLCEEDPILNKPAPLSIENHGRLVMRDEPDSLENEVLKGKNLGTSVRGAVRDALRECIVSFYLLVS